MPLGTIVLWEGDEMKKEKYIENARELVSLYGMKADLQHIVAVLVGPKANEAMSGKLAGIGIRKLAGLMVDELMALGLSRLEAQRLYAGFQLAQKWMVDSKPERFTIRSPEDGAKYLEDMKFLTQEHFVCLCLNTKNEVIRRETIFIGSLNASIVHPREVFSLVLRTAGTASLLVAHNHPSGNSEPSREDIEVTRRLSEAGKLVGIELLDHVIIGDGSYTSLKEKGYV